MKDSVGIRFLPLQDYFKSLTLTLVEVSMSIIYKTTNLINNKIYIGQHNSSADNYIGSGLNLNKAIKKYGKENFQREILEHVTSANVNEREIFWIAELSATDRNIGYNISSGGTGGKIYQGENPFKNKKHSIETKEKWSLKRKGYQRPNKDKENIGLYKYCFISPDNVIYDNILILKDFCDLYNLNNQSITVFLRRGWNKYKNWQIYRTLK
jgi:group I intron endonuclease